VQGLCGAHPTAFRAGSRVSRAGGFPLLSWSGDRRPWLLASAPAPAVKAKRRRRGRAKECIAGEREG
jgi:hypothetical protein